MPRKPANGTPKNGNNHRRYLTGSEAAKLIRISDRSLRDMRREGKGPPYSEINGRVIYDVEDIHAWMAKQKKGGTA